MASQYSSEKQTNQVYLQTMFASREVAIFEFRANTGQRVWAIL